MGWGVAEQLQVQVRLYDAATLTVCDGGLRTAPASALGPIGLIARSKSPPCHDEDWCSINALLGIPQQRKTRRSSLMGLEEDIIKLLKNEGFKMNEAIRDALDEFVDIVDEENEDMEENLNDDEEKEDKDEE
jgi:hypothetical protein